MAKTTAGTQGRNRDARARPGLSELVFIIDKSGSMAGLVDDTIGGYNAFVADNQRLDGEAVLTTVLFDAVSTTASTCAASRP